MFKSKILNIFESDRIQFLLLAFLPIIIIVGNLFINIFYLVFSIFAIYNFNNKKKFINSTIFYLLIFYLFCLFINLIFSSNFSNSLPRFLKFIFFILFFKEIFELFYFRNIDFDKIIKFWILIFFIVSADIVFELLFGFNSMGIKSPLPGRVSSFFGDELIVGSFYHFFSLFIIAFFLTKKIPSKYIFLMSMIIIIISFMIGERANFLKLFLSIFALIFICLDINIIKKTGIALLVILILGLISANNKKLEVRYYSQIKSIYTIGGLEKYFKESQYGALQNTAYQIFKNNILVGVGLKNFREESGKEIYINKEYKKTDMRWSTHPHQIHLEILSETGLIGYLSFLILIIHSTYLSIKNYLIFRNMYQLSTIIFLMTSLLPLLPTGSIFSTFFGGIFWFNYALMIGLNKKIKY